jgi:hypothetical protein
MCWKVMDMQNESDDISEFGDTLFDDFPSTSVYQCSLSCKIAKSLLVCLKDPLGFLSLLPCLSFELD